MKTDIILISIQKDLDVIGLKFLHYYLLHNGYNSKLLFLHRLKDKLDLEFVASFINKNPPAVIGISLMSFEYARAGYLTGFIKKHFPSIPILWGGIHPSIEPESCLKYADYVCVGEGEQTILDVAKKASTGNLDFRSIKNLCYKKSGLLERNPLYPLIEDLDKLPVYEHIAKNSYVQTGKNEIVPLTTKLMRKYGRYTGITYPILSSRGCPFACTYCSNSAMNKLYGSRKVRRRSIPHILSELVRAVKDNPYLEYIDFHDDCFLSGSKEYLQAFAQIYKRKIKKPFMARSIPTYINREKIGILKDAGIAWINLGLQSGSDRTCKEVFNRKSLQADFIKAARIVKDHNIAGFYDVILNNPFETEEDQLETIKTFTEIPKPYYTQLFSLTFYKGTALYERALKECPERVGDYIKKDFRFYENTILNDITRLSTFLEKEETESLVRKYKQNPNSLSFKLYYLLKKLKTVLFLEPMSYIRVVTLSHDGGIFKTLKLFSYFAIEGVPRYFEQFKSTSR